jgi:26S proteasome regulatory subunit N10
MLESTILLVDTSEYMRNGDYPPTRMSSQHDAANYLASAVINGNPESTVGVSLLRSRARARARVCGVACIAC